MKSLITFITLLGLFSYHAHAQYATPGDGETYDMDDLVSMSGGTVTEDDGVYLVHQELTISENDELEITDDITVKIGGAVRIIIKGTLTVDPPEEAVLTAIDPEDRFLGLRFDGATENSVIRNTTIEYAGGIQLLDTDMLFDNCIIQYFDMSNTSAAINLHNAHPVIQECLFLENAGAAIGSGANIQTSPHILNNEFIRNGTANTNRPQINMGPGGADTLRIIGNYIEGEHEMAGGIAVANLMSVGHTIALIEGNHVVDNRYGYAGMGSQITSIVQHNHFIDNNIQGQPNLGGSGLNFMGGTSNTAYVRGNIIRGNLWGVTIQNNAQPNLGEDANDLTGYNVIEDNENTGTVYGLYNNTPGAIHAQHNYWGTDNEEEAADYIVDEEDDASLGPVTFQPIWVPDNKIEAFVLEAGLHEGLDEDVEGDINHDAGTIELQVPGSVDMTSLTPALQKSKFAVSEPASGETVDLSEPVDYVVTAFHGETQSYTVSVEGEDPELFTVIFTVSLENAIEFGQLEGFDPDVHEIYITGEMTGWAEPGTDDMLVMQQTGTDPLEYSKTFELEAGDYEYKYFSDLLGDGWEGGEWDGDPNREIPVDADMEVYDNFGPSDIPGPYTGTVTFDVSDESGHAIPDAVITFDGTSYAAGEYEIEDIDAFQYYDFIVEHADYHTVEDNVYVYPEIVVEVIMEADDVQVMEPETIVAEVFPNPASEVLHIEAGIQIQELRMINLLGKTIYHAAPGHIQHLIDVSGLGSGVYFLQVSTEEGTITQRVQVVE